MSEGIVSTNKNNILFVGLLILGLSMHLFLGKLIIDNIESVGIILLLAVILVGVHLGLGNKLYHKGGAAQ